MKNQKNCATENCIPTLSSCVDWNGGDISFLNIDNGDNLNNLLWSLITSVQNTSLEDLTSFNIDALTSICNQANPATVTLISVLDIVANNEACLSQQITNLSEQLSAINSGNTVNANLMCFATADNLGNVLGVSRDQFDQLIINNLCSQQSTLQTISGEITNLQSEIDNILNTPPVVTEPTLATCLNAAVLPASSQLIGLASAFCSLETATGDAGDISTALAKTPGDWNANFGTLSGWNASPANWAQNYGNTLLEVENLRARLVNIETNCCGVSCKDVELGFYATFSSDQSELTIVFASGAGTHIPAGFTDGGSTGSLTDTQGNVIPFTPVIANNYSITIATSGLYLGGNILINVTSILSNGSITCQQCLTKEVTPIGCTSFCVITAVNEVTVIWSVTTYEGHRSVIVYNSYTIPAGQEFVLPPGGVLVGADGALNTDFTLSSECGSPSLEEFKCYVAIVAGAPLYTDTISFSAWQGGNAGPTFGSCEVTGFMMNGVFTALTTPAPFVSTGNIAAGGVTDIFTGLQDNIPAIICTADGGNFKSNGFCGGTYGGITYLVIRTIPSIGTSLMLVQSTRANINTGGGTPTAIVYVPFQDYDTIAADSTNYNTGFPACPTC